MPTQYDILIAAPNLNVAAVHRSISRADADIRVSDQDAGSFLVELSDEPGFILSCSLTSKNDWDDSKDERFRGYSHTLSLWVGLALDGPEARAMAVSLTALLAAQFPVALVYNREFLLASTKAGETLQLSEAPYVADSVRKAGFYEHACRLESGRLRVESLNIV